jgi:hypoxanthine phosphoribosyltransferase
MNPPAFPSFRVLFGHDAILRRTNELARAIAADSGDEPPLLLAVVEGARPFARVLQRVLPGQLPVHEVRAKSYVGTESTGRVTVTGAPADVRGRDILLIEDIVDTGRTIAALREHLTAAGARRCRVVTLLSKPSRRVVDVQLDYVGFEIPDEFVLGFGMDLDGRYRDVPDIVVYESSVEREFLRQLVADC